VSVTEDLIAQHQPWLTLPDGSYNQDLEDYLTVIGDMFAPFELYALDTDDGPGWSILLDVDRCPAPALPYLAQYVGERIPVGLTEDQQRQWIRDAPNQRRGTVPGIVNAARRYLTGTQLVTVIERDGGPDKLTVITYTTQTPNPAALEYELRYRQVPGDITLNYQVVSGQTYAQLNIDEPSYAAMEAAYPTYADVEADTPGGTH
jgi:hypothetical protein